MVFRWCDGKPSSLQASQQAGQGDGAAPAQGLAPEDGAIDLSTSGIDGATVTTMAGYIALVHKDEGTSYGVSFPDIPGCISAGDTFEEAIANAAEALAGHLALLRGDGDEVPPPRSFDELKRDPEFRDAAAGAIVTVVQPQRMPAETL